MIEQHGNLWDQHKRGEWIVITTNGLVKTTGEAVMGRGIASQCAAKFPCMPRKLGMELRNTGNHVYAFPEYHLLTMPVKHKWFEPADPHLIVCSVYELLAQVEWMQLPRVFLPRPGCGNGQLSWETVKPLLCDLDDRFTLLDVKG